MSREVACSLHFPEASTSTSYISAQPVTMSSSSDQERKPLLKDAEDGTKHLGDSVDARKNIQEGNQSGSWWEKNKEKVPGYGMWTLFRQVYAHVKL